MVLGTKRLDKNLSGWLLCVMLKIYTQLSLEDWVAEPKVQNAPPLPERMDCSEEGRKKSRFRDRDIMSAFFNRVERKDSCCWEWMGGVVKSNHPYGQIKYHSVQMLTHRFLWQMVFGVIPGKLKVLHKCDNPRCVSPFHLFLGTQKDNMEDCVKKGRYVGGLGMRHSSGYGENHKSHKLTDGKVIAIREKHRDGGVTMVDLAKMYGVANRTIQKIILGITWKHLL